MQAAGAGEAAEVRVAAGRSVGGAGGEGGVGAQRRDVGGVSEERDQRGERGVAGVVGGVEAHASRRGDERTGRRGDGIVERGDGEGDA